MAKQQLLKEGNTSWLSPVGKPSSRHFFRRKKTQRRNKFLFYPSFQLGVISFVFLVRNEVRNYRTLCFFQVRITKDKIVLQGPVCLFSTYRKLR